MSQHLSAAAAALNAPEVIVRRSAEAKAKATGASVDDVLAAWAGGAPVTATVAAAPVAAATAPEPADVAPGAEPATPAAAVAVAEAPPPVPEVTPPVVVEAEATVEAAALAHRRRVSGRIGAVGGAVSGLVALFLLVPQAITRASLTGEEGALRGAVEIGPLTLGSGEDPTQIAGTGAVIAAIVLLFMAAGIAVAHLSRAMTALHGRGMGLTGGGGATTGIGAGAGAVLGAVTGALIAGPFATPIEGTEGFVLIPVLAGSLTLLIGAAVMGWATGQLVQVFGVPEGEVAEDPEQSDAVRRRLGSAFSLPVLGVTSILLLVLPSAYVFLEFPSFAPVMAMIISAAILGFAGLAASRPGTKVTRGEFLAALGAIAVVVIIILAVLNATGAGHSEEEGHGEDGSGEPEAVLVVTTRY